MKKKITTGIKIVLVVIVVLFGIDKISFSENIDQQVSAHIYENGLVTGTTTVTMKGERTHYLFHNNEWYSGEFAIPSYEKSTTEGVTANIGWNNSDNIQDITYTERGIIYTDGVKRSLLVSEDMASFVLMMQNGAMLATSSDLYELYIKHFSSTNNSDMFVHDVYGVPKIQ